MSYTEEDLLFMKRALELAARGEGAVEPNPMVGCVIVRNGTIIGEGFHRFFGGPHAEVEAIPSAETSLEGATLYVTLEPCCHHGKTPPCTEAILQTGIRRVVVAMRDPFPKVDGGGIDQLTAAGIDVSIGCLENEAIRLNAPYLTRLTCHRPWIHAKWAMTLDGKIATKTGSSQWISSEASREIVHQLRGRMDAILIGSRTADLDNPLLTARPQGARIPIRIVFDSKISLSPASQLAQTAREVPVMIVAGPNPNEKNLLKLHSLGCQIILSEAESYETRLRELFSRLAEKGMTNLLVEGGGELLGHLFDLHLIDECHVFVAPKIVGGRKAITPVAGEGFAQMAEAITPENMQIQTIDTDIYFHGRINKMGSEDDQHA